MNELDAPLLVELFLNGARIKGLCREVGRRRRLAEVLNTPSDVFELESAVVTLSVGAPMHAPSLAIEKRSIIAAIPWETREQNRHRALETSTLGRAQTTPMTMVAFSPPFVFSGTAHMPAGYVTTRGKLHPDPNIFAHFFSVTGAQMTLPDGSQLEAPVIIVNREAVSAMSRVAEPAALRLVS